MNIKELKGYTYDQLATLVIQIQGLLKCSEENYAKLSAENEMLREKLKLIDSILHPGKV